MTIAQTTMIAASLAILIYIAILVTGSLLTTPSSKDAFTLQSEADSALREQVATNLDYVHKSNTDRSSLTVLLNGVTLGDQEFILLYDSTPYASKGHIAMNLPCNENNPEAPLFRVLVGRAPDLTPMPLGHIEPISEAPETCVYHTQFGFGDPVTDVALQNASGEEIRFRGPHSVVITAHESYIPTTPSFKETQH